MYEWAYQDAEFDILRKHKKKKAKQAAPASAEPGGRIRFFSRRGTATRGKHHAGRMTSERHFLLRFDPRACAGKRRAQH